MHKPTIAITMGDAAGIGPEIVVKVLLDHAVYESCSPIVIGDPEVMRRNCQLLGADLCVQRIGAVGDAEPAPDRLNVLLPEGLALGEVAWGKLDPLLGQAAALCIKEALRQAAQGHVQGAVSAPMNKEAFRLAGYEYRDELQYMAELTHSEGTFMLGVLRGVWTVTVTEHVPFREIADLITRQRVLWRTLRLHETLIKLGYDRQRIAVAALNVHGGEGGLVGREEVDQIGPAIEDARARGIDAAGPVPADTVFGRALAGEFDGVVAMYHDQANIARKLQPMQERATLFMGLPVPWGTTAHGTAFDIAGKGVADPGSLRTALDYVAVLSR